MSVGAGSILPDKRPASLAASVEDVAKWGGLVDAGRVDDGVGARSTVLHTGTTRDLLASACKAVAEGRHSRGGGSWEGGDFETCMHLAVAGWHEGTALVDGLYSRITSEQTDTILPRLAHVDEPDGEIDVALAIEGEEACWLAPTQGHFRVSVQGRFLNLIMDPFASCGVDVDVVMQRGVYFAALAVMAERGGYRTRITLRMPSKGSGRTWLLDVAVKEYDEDLDLPRAMFWLAHPGMVRHMVLGAYQNYRTDMISMRSDGSVPDDAILAPGIAGYGTVDLDAWLAKVLKTHGLTVEGE